MEFTNHIPPTSNGEMPRGHISGPKAGTMLQLSQFDIRVRLPREANVYVRIYKLGATSFRGGTTPHSNILPRFWPSARGGGWHPTNATATPGCTKSHSHASFPVGIPSEPPPRPLKKFGYGCECRLRIAVRPAATGRPRPTRRVSVVEARSIAMVACMQHASVFRTAYIGSIT